MFRMGVLAKELLLHLLVTQVKMNLLVHVIYGAERQPVVLPVLVLGQLDVLAVQVIHLTVVVPVRTNHRHVLPDLLCLCHGWSVVPRDLPTMKKER